MKIIAHRGDTTNHPENTLEAFQAAIRNGADGIELDVHTSSDGILFVHHDYYLGNPDNGTGRIYEKEAAYLRSLAIPPSSHISTLDEILNLLGKTIHYEIEIKSFTKESLRNIIQLVTRHGLLGTIEFTSPHTYVLSYLKILEPKIQTGAFVIPPPSWMDKKLAQTIAVHNALLGGIDILHCPLSLLDTQFIKVAHKNNLLVHAADCDTTKDFRTAFELGVDQLSTNELKRALLVKKTYS